MAASTTLLAGPAMVTTERLWSLSSEKSKRLTPSTCIAATMDLTLSSSEPSEKLGTHSSIGPAAGSTAVLLIHVLDSTLVQLAEFRPPLLPPGIAQLELHTGIDARIMVAQAGAGDVYRICAETYG